MADLKALADAVIKGDQKDAMKITKAALEKSTPAKSVLYDGLIVGMDVIGARFKKNEVYIPDVLIAARAMKMAMEILEPELLKAGVKPIAKFLIGTVQGDLHDIGKNLVAMMLKGAGWKVVDLGVDVAPDKFVQAAIDENADVIGLSALLTTTMVNMKEVVELAKNKDCKAKIVVGGAPLTQSYADEIGAHGYAPDAATASEIVGSFA